MTYASKRFFGFVRGARRAMWLVALALGAASAAAQPFAYVTHIPNEVHVIDTSSDSVVTVLGVPDAVVNSPQSVAVTPNGAFVYVLSFGTPSSVTVIDAQTQTVLTNIPVPEGAGRSEALAATPDGTRVYVTSADSAFAWVIDTATQTAMEELVPQEGDATHIAIARDGTRVYLTRRNLNFNFAVLDIDPASKSYHTILAHLQVPDGIPHGVAIAADHRFAYVTRARGSRGALAIIDLDPASETLHTVVATIDLEGSPVGAHLAVAPNGAFAYIATDVPNEGGVVAVLDTDPASPTFHEIVAGTSTLPQFPVGVAFTPEGDRAYFTGTCFLCNSVSVLSTADHSVISSSEPGLNSGGIAITPPAVN